MSKQRLYKGIELDFYQDSKGHLSFKNLNPHINIKDKNPKKKNTLMYIYQKQWESSLFMVKY